MLMKNNELIPSAIWVFIVVVAAVSASDFGKPKTVPLNSSLIQAASNQEKNYNKLDSK